MKLFIKILLRVLLKLNVIPLKIALHNIFTTTYIQELQFFLHPMECNNEDYQFVFMVQIAISLVMEGDGEVCG